MGPVSGFPGASCLTQFAPAHRGHLPRSLSRTLPGQIPGRESVELRGRESLVCAPDAQYDAQHKRRTPEAARAACDAEYLGRNHAAHGETDEENTP